jgi:hypothetical protein
MSASATQAKSPLVVTAVSVWASPAAPGTQLDPSDPHVLRLAGRILSFTLVSSGDQYMPQFLDSYYTETIESLPGETGTIEEVVVPQYGQGSRAATGIGEGLRFDVIASYDGKFSYALVALAAATSPSAIPTLSAIAEQLFAPARPDYLMELPRFGGQVAAR